MRRIYILDCVPFSVTIGGKEREFFLSLDFVFCEAVPASPFGPGEDAHCVITEATVFDAKGENKGSVPEWLWDLITTDDGIQSDMCAHAIRCRQAGREDAADARLSELKLGRAA